MAVTIPNSAGYAGDIDATEWAQLIPFAGEQYGVADESSWVATPGAADREVRISNGSGFGGGIIDRTTAEASLVLPVAASGSVWHMIHVHRDWNTNRSTLTSKAGTASRQLPARDSTPGVADDQPLWLARVDAGKSQVQDLVDLRVWGGAYAADEIVLQYMNRLGTRLRIGAKAWERGLNSLKNPAWSSYVVNLEAGLTLNGGWEVEPGTAAPSVKVANGMVSLNGRIRAGFVPGATPHAFTLPEGARPPAQRVTSVMRPSNAFETVIVDPSGAVTFFNVELPSNDYRLASIPPWPVA